MATMLVLEMSSRKALSPEKHTRFAGGSELFVPVDDRLGNNLNLLAGNGFIQTGEQCTIAML